MGIWIIILLLAMFVLSAEIFRCHLLRKQCILKSLSYSDENTYQIFFENSIDAMLIIKDGRFIDCNNATVKMLGYKNKEEILNTHPYDLSPEFQSDGKSSKDKAAEMINIAITEGKHLFEWEHKRKDGKVFSVDVSLTAVTFEGETIIHTVWRDISRRKKVEQEVLKMQKLKSIGSLAGGIAHDFNNILLGIFGNISLAKLELDETHPAYPLIRDAEKAINRASSLTKQLLTFSKGGTPVTASVNAERLTKEITLFTLTGSNLKPKFHVEDNLWPIEADKGQFQQIISNLILNAKQAMPDGGKLDIAFKNTELPENNSIHIKRGRYVKITITDNGRGIEKEHIEHIFDPYFSTKHTGNGLGLATVYSIISKHKGHIEVESTPGKGTVFILYMPASANPPTPDSNMELEALSESVTNSKILVMDDEEYILKVVEKSLQKHGYTVKTAINGEEAIEKYSNALEEKKPFDAVLMDLTISDGMGGKEAATEILKINPDANLIVFSGYSTDPVIAEYHKYGFKGRLTKPFNQKELLTELTRIIT